MNSLIIFILLFFSPDDALKNKIDAYLNSALADYSEYEYEIVKQPENYSSIEIVRENELRMNSGFIYLPVEITSSKIKSRSYITLKVKLFKEVLVAQNSVPKQSILSKGNFILEKIDVSAVKGEPLTSFDNLENYRSKINLNAGSVLVYEWIEANPVLKNGDFVKANYVSGNVSLSVDAFSKEEGAVGENIRIVTKDKKIFKAKVLDKNNVIIIE